jgi:curli biogenesis system outer membrane secretion channel CsgG
MKPGNLNLTRPVTSTAVPQSATAMLVTALKDSHWFIPLEPGASEPVE